MSEEKDTRTEAKAEQKPAEEQRVETQHSVTIGGKSIKYAAIAGTLVLKEEDDEKGEHKPKASVYYTAYIAEQPKSAKPRPLTFSFNGGPGSSSVWLHLGVLGPRRVDMPLDDSMPRPPFGLVDNEYSILAETDLVFIDPVTTGYSRPVPGEAAKQFHGFQKDLETVGEFIRLFTTRHQRWSSPKFLIGESYGTTRAAGLSGHLVEKGIALNGVVLVSSILNFQTARFTVGNDLPYPLYLPTFTATAFYHKRLAPELQKDLQATLREAEAFAAGPYTAALAKGDRLTDAEKDAVATQLARLTGLEKAYCLRANLRVHDQKFYKELLRDKDRVVGRLDSRFTGVDPDGIGDTPEHDPSLSAIRPPYTAAFNDYVRRDLGYVSDLEYHILGGGVGRWDFGSDNRYADTSDALRQAFSKNPFMKLFVANGYYDVATPYFATQYTLSHMRLDAGARARVRQGFYEAGHMMYIEEKSLVQLKKDVGAFLEAAIRR